MCMVGMELLTSVLGTTCTCNLAAKLELRPLCNATLATLNVLNETERLWSPVSRPASKNHDKKQGERYYKTFKADNRTKECKKVNGFYGVFSYLELIAV